MKADTPMTRPNRTRRAPLFAAAAVSLTGGALAVGVIGCAVGPKYERPATNVAGDFAEPAYASTRPSTAPSQVVGGTSPIVQWWTTFHDPELDKLVDRAVASNFNLKVATQRVREARAQRASVFSGAFPQVNLGVDYTHSRISGNGVTSQIGGGGGGGAGGGSSGGSSGGSQPGSNGSPAIPGSVLEEFDLYQVGFDASWELDIFGRVRRGVEAANAAVQASVEGRRDVLLTLLGEVARNYVELRGLQRQYAIAVDNLNSQRQTLELTRQQLANGVSNALNVARAEAQVATTAAQVPTLQTQISQSIHQLGTLLGEQPTALAAELGQPAPVPPVPALVPIGLPSDLLRRRPDVRQAERNLAAATANTGVAVAGLFPSVSLTGSLGFQSVRPGNVFEYASRYYSVGPAIDIPLFDAGRRWAQVQLQDARQQQAFYQYQQTVLDALREVEDALVAYDKQQVRRQSLVDAVDANRRAVSLSRELYTQGLSDFTTVLDAERSLFSSQDALASSDTQVSSTLVTLYKALGGGWELGDDAFTDPRQAATRPEAQAEVAAR